MSFQYGTVNSGEIDTLQNAFTLPSDIQTRTIFVKNGTGALVTGLIEFSPDKNTWGTLDGTTFNALAIGAVKFARIDGYFPFIRLKFSVATTVPTTFNWWIKDTY